MTLLFLCTGNSCRSPMAEVWFNRQAAAVGSPWRAGSAGVSAIAGLPMSNHAQAALRAAGVEPAVTARHASRPFTGELAAAADLIVALSHRHLCEARRRHPECAGKLRLLGEFSGHSPAPDIEDPFGGDLATYRECLAQIQHCVQQLLASLN